MSVSRRNFFKYIGVAGLGAMLPGAAKAAEAGEELVTLLDLSKCVACGACVDACRDANQNKYPEPIKPYPVMHPQDRVPVADWSDKRNVDDRLTPYNWLFIQTATGTWQGRDFEINIPRRCLHCQNPPCANLCPWGAASKQVNGIVRINDKICLGGSKCKSVCPWHIPERQTGVGLYLNLLPSLAGNGVMYKCDRCWNRIAEGKIPACIEACPFEVQTIGPRSEIVTAAHDLAVATNGFIYGEHENGGTNTLYVSPIPFDVLNEAIETGPGRPHLGPAPDPFAFEDKLALAVYAAPVAGLAAGLLHVARSMNQDEKEEKHEGK
ncbi:MAG: 4Fe-4S dicluster domain-containing protein [Deltaproteobacteria bacterium]|nr:4Fe-4S dicluster domain-containing protein [Deltaproteobacteria bacterium]